MNSTILSSNTGNIAIGLVAAAMFASLIWSFSTFAKGGSEGAAVSKQVVQRSFDAWAAGTGSPYELLKDDVRWEIVGHSAASKTYPSREAFLSEVIRPFNARMQAPLKPVVRGIYGNGDMVIVLFDASGIARDGKPYTNTYSWYLRMEGGRIASATAFFDSIAFNDLWSRVSVEGAR